MGFLVCLILRQCESNQCKINVVRPAPNCTSAKPTCQVKNFRFEEVSVLVYNNVYEVGKGIRPNRPET